MTGLQESLGRWQIDCSIARQGQLAGLTALSLWPPNRPPAFRLLRFSTALNYVRHGSGPKKGCPANGIGETKNKMGKEI